MIGAFIVISVAVLIITAHTPEEWAKIFSNINE